MVGTIGSGLQSRWEWDANRRMRVAMAELGRISGGRLISHRVLFREAPTGYQATDERPSETLGVLLEYT